MSAAPRVTIGVRRAIGTVVFALACSSAVAHADFLASDPPADAVVEEAPEQVRLSFTEVVETAFSVFKVYLLDLPSLDQAAQEEPDFLRLNGLAAALASEALPLRDDAEARSDEGLVDPEPRADEVTIALRADLEPGAYVVMWRVLALDGHPTQGHAVFVVAPTDQSER